MFNYYGDPALLGGARDDLSVVALTRMKTAKVHSVHFKPDTIQPPTIRPRSAEFGAIRKPVSEAGLPRTKSAAE